MHVDLAAAAKCEHDLTFSAAPSKQCRRRFRTFPPLFFQEKRKREKGRRKKRFFPAVRIYIHTAKWRKKGGRRRRGGTKNVLEIFLLWCISCVFGLKKRTRRERGRRKKEEEVVLLRGELKHKTCSN